MQLSIHCVPGKGRVHASGVPFVNDFSKVVGFPVKMGQLFEARKRI